MTFPIVGAKDGDKFYDVEAGLEYIFLNGQWRVIGMDFEWGIPLLTEVV